MAAVSVRDLDDGVRDRLRLRAAGHGRSMEAEIRAILTDAVSEDQEIPSLATALMSGFGGVDLDLPPRGEPTRAADLGE